MLSKTAATITTSALQTQANSYFKALFTRPEATGLAVNATYTNTNGNQVVVKATANVKTNFMNLMGFSTMQVAADSQVKWGNSRLRVALVLDNTGSMADDGKMPALITAAKTLLTSCRRPPSTTATSMCRSCRSSRTSMSAPPTTRRPGSTGPIGSRQRHLQQFELQRQPEQLRVGTARPGPRQPQHLERLRDGSRQLQRAERGNYDQNVTAPTTSTTATLYAAEQYTLPTLPPWR